MEILEAIATINYNNVRPRPVHAASLFDLVKIRRLVDEATNLAVRAASDIASPTLTNVHGSYSDGHSMNSLGMGGSGHGVKLSRERKFRMREQASQKLARAYRMDEIASSVATMQGSTPLEEVGSSVLHRNPQDPDAKYVHFFHEKIPSRQLAESTSTVPLSEVLADQPNEPGVFRTRATVKVFKEDYDGAIADLSYALSACRFHQPDHPEDRDKYMLSSPPKVKRRVQDTVLADKDQPTTLEGQLLFQRASVYLTLASRHVSKGVPQKPRSQDAQTGDAAAPQSNGADLNGAKSPDIDKETLKKQLEARKVVKTLAKRAMKDYMAFLEQFDYSPNFPVGGLSDFNDRVNLAVQGYRTTRNYDVPPGGGGGGFSEPLRYNMHSVASLFAAVPPDDLPPFPSQDLVLNGRANERPSSSECETTSYHPLLSEALHSLLLCHCLAQTSPKELQRHAYMVARLVRLSDGYPIFQASRSPSRADWVEVLRRGENWIQLCASWDELCSPAPIPIYEEYEAEQKMAPNPEVAASAAAALISGHSPDANAEQIRKERAREQAIIEALDDDRVTDEDSFRAAIFAREQRAQKEVTGKTLMRKHTHHDGYTTTRPVPGHPSGQNSGDPSIRRWAAEDSRDYPILTDRALAITTWVREAPRVTGMTKRKKKPKKTPSKVDDIAVQVSKLDVGEAEAED